MKCPELERLRQLYKTALIRWDYLKTTGFGAGPIGIPKWRAAQEHEQAIRERDESFRLLSAHERTCLVCTNSKITASKWA